ncbi:hypothetical protein [Cellulomonas timonensis]|uniref:hypothetical protein n=1 Tax=Cellulomonas timonensis TaxID=1689271 RepID=UPI000B26BA17|nr:hypothetical protein [Cellulomonas timonensis]
MPDTATPRSTTNQAEAVPARPTPRADGHLPKFAASLLALTAIVVVLLVLFILPSLKSGARDLPIGTVGDAHAVQVLGDQLDVVSPGAFDTAAYDDEAALRTAILDRAVVGGVVVENGSARLLTASAGSAPIAGELTGSVTAAGAGIGMPVAIEDLVTFTTEDPTGIGIGGLAFPLVFGGIVPAVVAMRVFPHSLRLQLASAGSFAVVGGVVVTAVLRFWFGSFDGSILLPAAALALGIAAISVPLIGLQSTLGGKGFTALAASMMFLGNPLAGIGASAAWLPSGLGLFGQLLPPGSTGTLVRSAAYFDGRGAGSALVVLLVWVVAGVGLCVLGKRRTAGAQAPVATELAPEPAPA